MTNKNNNKFSEEYLRKFRHRTGYVISESPKYRPLVDVSDEFDEIPQLTNEAGEQEDAEKQGQVPPEPTNDTPQDIESPVPAFDVPDNSDTDGLEGMPPESTPSHAPANPMGEPEEPTEQVDDLQNEIIKHNIEAMKGIHTQLEGLSTMFQDLNSKMDSLTADVEEVREPSNTEKLMNKTSVSYPYYFNLNDLWQNNWFDQKREEEVEKGIKELPDGTFIADFDDLPQKSKIDVQNSFNEIN